MSGIDLDSDDWATPEGVVFRVERGWFMSARARSDFADVRIGGSDMPEAFEMTVTSTVEPWTAHVMFMWTEDKEMQTVGAWATGAEVHEAMDALRKVAPMSWWKRKCLLTLAIAAAERRLEDERGPAYSALSEDDKRQDEAVFAHLVQSIQAAAAIPVTRRRNRVTPQLLAEVAQVYRKSWQDPDSTGPTKAVAAHFQVSHSTAARWVGLARHGGQLGPADGSRGGEL